VEHGIIHLNQVADPRHTTIWKQAWLSGHVLGLPNQHIPLWEDYIGALSTAHIHIQDRQDELYWVGDPSGIYTPKEGYIKLCTKLFDREEKWWWRKVWKLRCPTKARLLTWMNIENKMPTWDILQKRNHHGPGWCCLCKSKNESISHLFIKCRFTKEVWKELSVVYGKLFDWDGETIEQALGRWIADKSLKTFDSLPAVVSWGIWIHRNRNIFNDRVSTPQLVAANSVAIANHFLTIQKPPHTRILFQEVIDKSYPWGYFDGAAQGDPTMCGAGALLFLEESH
jgi:ribonuclease HI